jgi:5-formyltetrahydrofolate cyclo-ligase
MRVAKNELRQKMRDLRARLAAPEVARRSAAAAQRVLALPEIAGARCVALYAAIAGSNEIQTGDIHAGLHARGVRIAYPRVRAGVAPLAFGAADDPAQLVPSRLGIPQPDAQATEVALDEIDVFVIPGLAFDELGERLGWGRGHYDRTLSAAPAARRVGYAFDFQIVSRVPAGADDQRVDLVITDTGALQAPPRRAP